MPKYIHRRFLDFKEAYVELAKLHFPEKDLSSELDTEMLIGDGMSMIGESLGDPSRPKTTTVFSVSQSVAMTQGQCITLQETWGTQLRGHHQHLHQ